MQPYNMPFTFIDPISGLKMCVVKKIHEFLMIDWLIDWFGIIITSNGKIYI